MLAHKTGTGNKLCVCTKRYILGDRDRERKAAMELPNDGMILLTHFTEKLVYINFLQDSAAQGKASWHSCNRDKTSSSDVRAHTLSGR